MPNAFWLKQEKSFSSSVSAVRKWDQGAKGTPELLCQEEAGVIHVLLMVSSQILASLSLGEDEYFLEEGRGAVPKICGGKHSSQYWIS